jgi:hypothetical protein
MSFKAAIKNKLIEGAALAADAKIDGREIGRTILSQIAEQTNDVSKRKIARGPVSNLILEVVEGLWENDATALADELDRRAKNLRGAVRPAGSPVQTESKRTTNVSPGNTSTR